jgi:DNA-binding transcriptional regulator YiaG
MNGKTFKPQLGAPSAAENGTVMTGQDFKNLREKLGLNQDKCAVLVGGYQAKISRWENGESRIPTAAANLMRVLAGEVSLDSLLRSARSGGLP